MALTVDIDVQTDYHLEQENSDDPRVLITTHEWETWFQAWLVFLNPELSPIHVYALGLRLTDDHQMEHFNSTFRHINQPTDVLAFASLERDALPPQIWDSQPLELGDIIISVETACRQASEHQHSLKQEIAWLASHGLLHLLGWDHPTREQLNSMLDVQQKLLSQVGLPYQVKKCINEDI